MIVRTLAAVALVATAAALLVIAWPSLFGLAGAPVVAQLVSLRGLSSLVAVVGAAGVALVAIAWRGGRRFLGSLAVLALAFAAINLAVLSTRGVDESPLAPPADGELTVLTWNTLGDAPGVEAIADLVLAEGADITVLPETSLETAEAVAIRLRDAGRPMWVHTVAFDQIAKARSTSVLVSAAIGEYVVDDAVGNTRVLPSVVLRPLDHDGPTIIGVHAVAPIPGELANWRADLEWIDGICRGGNTIMAGDVNATADHFTATADGPGLGDCIDAAIASGSGAVGTWPTQVPPLLGAPIDHILVTPDLTVTGFRVITELDDAGSDHRPVVARVRVAD